MPRQVVTRFCILRKPKPKLENPMRKKADDEDCRSEKKKKLFSIFTLIRFRSDWVQTENENNDHSSDVPSILCLRIFKAAPSAGDALHLPRTMLQLLSHQGIEDADDR